MNFNCLSLIKKISVGIAFWLFVPFVGASDGFVVIVNSANAVSSLSSDEVSRILLKKKTKWNDIGKIVPIDQDAANGVASSFSKEVHKKSISSLKSYWQQMIFSGKGTPPKALKSDDEVIRFVTSNTNAIGYVSADASDLDGVKVISLGL